MAKTLFQDDHTQIIKDRATGYEPGEKWLRDRHEQLGRDRATATSTPPSAISTSGTRRSTPAPSART
ncbi:MAG: hypothetical protein MZU79_07185 [Anaerotruncus sp.]|nr:hypothetical protein [Anaerotruncus sp.]